MVDICHLPQYMGTRPTRRSTKTKEGSSPRSRMNEPTPISCGESVAASGETHVAFAMLAAAGDEVVNVLLHYRDETNVRF